jgi:hypothetical protein
MAAKQSSKAYQDETVTVVYGISRVTKTVRSVYVARNGSLSWSTDIGGMGFHRPQHGSPPEVEASLVLNLTDAFSVPAALIASDGTKVRIEELEEQARKMREENEAKDKKRD